MTRGEFDSFGPARMGLLDAITDEAEFYVADGDFVIGTLVHDQIDNDWNFVVLGRDQAGVFRGIDVRVSIEDCDEARELLIESMRSWAESGNTVFPQ